MTETRVDPPQLSRDEWGVLLGLGAALPGLMVLFLVFLVDSLVTTIGIVVTALVPAVVTITIVVTIGRLHVSRLTLMDSGVEIGTWLGHSEVPWTELRLWPRVAGASFVSLSVQKPGRGPSVPFLLSVLQAHALASEPRLGEWRPGKESSHRADGP